MPEPKGKDKAEDTVKRRKRKPLEYQRFERLLKMAVKTPPMQKSKNRLPVIPTKFI